MKKQLLLLLTAYVLLLPASPIQAARFYLKSQGAAIAGQESELSLLVDTEGEGLNAFEGKLLIPEGLEVKSTDDGNSIISLWIDRPPVSKGEMFFSGGLPGGYTGSDGLLFSMKIVAEQPKIYDFKGIGLKALIADGLGSEAKNSPSQLTFNFASGTQATTSNNKLDDLYPPEIFSVEITSQSDIFDNQYFLVFSTTDKESGLDHYEVKESGGNFVRAISPYLLKNQDLPSSITVRAYDQAGNYREAMTTSMPADGQGLAKNYRVYFLVFALCLFALFAYIKSRPRRS